ncbi:unnamed protein product [Diatraea saccharalis]|uniref:Uncharacterized protein n=1 Tax=Diatraea saccharalis TaxID=40085 RepID=A0A9N9RG22_9NEOP|nr:unnamed protein product [Diatraea saccharalis]
MPPRVTFGEVDESQEQVAAALVHPHLTDLHTHGTLRACAAATRAGGEGRAVRCARETLDALRRDGDNRPPHVIVVDARQPQMLDATLLANGAYQVSSDSAGYSVAFYNTSPQWLSPICVILMTQYHKGTVK